MSTRFSLESQEMPPQYTRADSLREALTGATADGGTQTSPNNSLGHYRSATEAVSLGITIGSALSGVTVLYAGGANPTGLGTLTAIDANHLTWQPFGAASAGPPTSFSGTGDIEIVEAANSPGAYLRVSCNTPLSPGACTVTLSTLVNNQFGFDDVAFSQATAGESEYRASIVRNESSGSVSGWQRWIATLGTGQVSNAGDLGASGSGTIQTTGTFVDWPNSGWCQVQSSGGSLKEVVYYTSRSLTTLTVPASGRGLLGTSATAGALTDLIFPVPGVAIAIDSGGIQSFGTNIQTIANTNTAPTGVTWNLGITPAMGLQIGSLGVSQQVGLWMWRQIPPGAVATPAQLVKLQDNFSAF